MVFIHLISLSIILLAGCTGVQQSPKSSKASKVIFYENGGSLQNENDFDSMIATKNRRGKTLGFVIQPEILSEHNNGDSIIYEVALNVTQTNNKMIGKPLPDFNLNDIDGKLVKLSDLKGKPIILNFWFVLCSPCIAEMPALNVIKAKYSKTDIEFISMTFETKEAVKKFLKKTPINFRIIPDTGDYSKIFHTNFPLTIFVNRQGIITDIQNGLVPIYDKQLKKTSEQMDDTAFINSLNVIK